jgi:hypothetical protein
MEIAHRSEVKEGTGLAIEPVGSDELRLA